MIPLANQPEQCVYCGQKFRLARTVISHMCEKKRRALQRTEKRVQTGFMVFNKFFQVSSNSNKNKTYEEFCDSPFYNSFVKFGGYVNNINAIHPEMFMDYVVRSGVKLDHWCRDEVYFKYLYDMLKKEPTESALQRSLLTMMEWSDTTGAEYNSYFQNATTYRIAHDIVHGRVSPWVILNTTGGKNALRNMDDAQLTEITPAMDVQYWQRRFRERPDDASLVKDVCRDAGIQ